MLYSVSWLGHKLWLFISLQDGETALTEACSHDQGMSAVVTVLLRAGARTDIQDQVPLSYG